MDLRRLQAFVAIAELKNFTKAAELLHIAQPALGLKIRKLEEDLEQQLFVRHSRGVMVTEAGKFLLPQARAMLAQASALKQVMRDFSCPPHGRVVMGVPPNVMEGITGIIARRAIQELPDVNLNMVEGLSHTLEEWLDDGRLNLACVFDGSDETTGRPGQVLYEEPFVFVGNADALRPEDGPITLAEALRQPLVVPAVPHRLRALLEDKARELGEQVHVRFEVESGSIMNDLIAQKLGYSILPASVVSSRVQRGELAIRRIFQPDWSCTLRLVWPLGGDLSSATQAVIKLVSEVDEEARKSRAGA
jgi:LysR family nitrogen assimilation transcriptional regulator